MHKAKRAGIYISVVAGVLDSVTGKVAAQTESTSGLGYSITAYILGIGIIMLSVLIIRLMLKYYNRQQYEAGIEEGREAGKEEILLEQEEEAKEKDEEDEVTEEEKEDIDYDMVIDDLGQFSESLGDEDKDQPIVQNINKFVTGYKFLKPPDVAVLSLTKRFDEYEVSIALPEKKKGASKISEFIPFDDKTRKDIQDEFDAVSQLNNSMVGMPNMGGMGPIITSRMDNLGKSISDNFIPEAVMKNLQTIKDPIIIESNDGEILWETIHDGKNFIALEHPIGRVLKTKEEARVNDFERGEKLKFLMICNPTGDLESTEKEVNYIESILKQKVLIDKYAREEATKENLLNALSSGEYDVIHYAGHADSESAGEAALVMADGKLFSSEIKKALMGRPYVYLNACGSGRESMEESKDYTQVSDTEGLASSFILGGAIGFMGAMWRLPDKSAAEFSVAFYEGLIENLKVGEACRKARLAIKKETPSDITWAAFLQYGDPVQRLREKKELDADTDEELEDDAEVEVVDEDDYEKTEEEGEEAEEEEKEEELTEEEKLKQYQGWLMGGLEHFKNKKYEDAITAFDSAIGIDTERYNAWHLTGNALRELRRYNEALEIYDKALERDSTVDEIWYDKALALGAVGRFDEAMECKETVDTLQVGRVKEWLRKANELMARGGARDAIKIYNRILKENEKYPLAWYLKGLAYAELDDNKSALKSYDQSIKYGRKFSQGYHKKAELLFKLERNEEALENIDKALDLNPINEDAMILKSDILTKLGQYKSALVTVNHILVVNKTNADALIRKADILRRYNKNEESLECYEEVLKLDPESQEGWFRRTLLLNELGINEEAELEGYNTLQEMDIEDKVILKGISIALEEKDGLYQEKVNWFDKIILHNPNSVRAWLNMGIALENLDKKEEALEAYEKVIELDKSNGTALTNAASLFEQMGEFKKARDYNKRLIKIDPTNYEAVQHYADLQKNMGKPREALKGYLQLYKIEPENTKVLSNLREIYFELGQKKNAITVSKKLLKINPDDVENQYAYAKILYEFKNYPEVIKYTDKLIEAIPDDTHILIMRAEAFSNMEKMDKAIECWDRIIALKEEEGPGKEQSEAEPEEDEQEEAEPEEAEPEEAEPEEAEPEEAEPEEAEPEEAEWEEAMNLKRPRMNRKRTSRRNPNQI
jgi:tetratricopeptide (TPR) repeat protein